MGDSMRKKLSFILGVIVLVASSLTGCMKIVKIGEEGKLTGEVTFNAGDNVAEIWDTTVVPDLTKKAVDLTAFLTEASGDLKSLANKYGKYSMGTSGELSYTVKGVVTVKKVNTEKKAGYMEVTLEGYTGKEVIRLQIGPVYKGSAVRDSLEFIRFEDYKNQVDYAAVSQSLHDTIQKNIIANLNINGLVGKQIEFVGCFTVDKNDLLIITPVVIEVK